MNVREIIGLHFQIDDIQIDAFGVSEVKAALYSRVENDHVQVLVLVNDSVQEGYSVCLQVEALIQAVLTV